LYAETIDDLEQAPQRLGEADADRDLSAGEGCDARAAPEERGRVSATTSE